MGASGNLASLLSGLSESRFRGYLHRPIPCELDDEVQILVEAYQVLDSQERDSLHEALVGEPVDILESFAERQAVLAVRSESMEPIRLGLTALGMSSRRGDPVQIVMALAKLDHSARLLGADLADSAAEVAEVLPDEARYTVAKFLAREDRDGSLLTKLGFSAYGSGPDFVYDNAAPGAASTAASPATPAVVRRESGGAFVARQRYTSTIPGDPVAIRVKDGALGVIDQKARRSVFPLIGPDAPVAVVRAFKGTDRWWVVIDRQGWGVISAADDDWSQDVFAALAEAAGLRFDLEALAPEYVIPAPRPDSVNLSREDGSGWLLFVGFIVLAFMAIYAVIGLWQGFPWLWAVLWGSVGTWWNTSDYRAKVAHDRGVAALPPDERPVTTRREVKLARSFLGLAAFALGPPALAYLIRDSGPSWP